MQMYRKLGEMVKLEIAYTHNMVLGIVYLLIDQFFWAIF